MITLSSCRQRCARSWTRSSTPAGACEEQKRAVAKQGEGWREQGVRRHGGSNAGERRFDFRQVQTRRSLYFGLLHRQMVEGDGHLLKVDGFRQLRQMLKVTQILMATACLLVSLQMFQVD